jgi:hypothetical protein
MIDLLGELAQVEDRYAVDVLNDMLQPTGDSAVNGSAVQQPEKSAVP